MKNLANYISISRIIMSILLVVPKTLTKTFFVIYAYCGISDILDGYIARKSKNTTQKGAMLDSIADIIFLIVSVFKIIPFINLQNGIIIWIIIIALIKIINILCAVIYYEKIILPHTIANKITGLMLFIIPVILINRNIVILEIFICIVATFSAIQEGIYIRTRKI